MIVAACDKCENSIIIRSAIIEEEIVVFVFIVVFVVIIVRIYRQDKVVTRCVALFDSEEISSTGQVNQNFLIFYLGLYLGFCNFVLFFLARQQFFNKRQRGIY